MPLSKLHHYLILCNDLDATKDFYVAALHMTVGERPAFRFPGYWLYLDGVPCVHLASAKVSPEQRGYLADSDASTGSTGPIDHVAFTAHGLAEMVAHLEALQLGMTRRDVPGQGLHQVFINDPNGVKIELNFNLDEVEHPAG